jgi:ethanolamine utilization protein EutQ (cupin superfamily)
MPNSIERPTRVAAFGAPPKVINEYVGRVNTAEHRLSIAHMRSPAGWSEPGQMPEFDEYTLVLSGAVRIEHRGGVLNATAGQAVLTRAGEWVRYQTPTGAEYISVCLPAFALESVHRDAAT